MEQPKLIIIHDPKGSSDIDTPNRCSQIIEPLIQWLEPFRGMTGPVFRKEWKKTLVYQHRESIGLLIRNAGKKENYKLYPSNTLRHTACSAWSGKFTRGVAAKQVGNSEKKQASNYDHVWTKKQAEEFFSLAPQYINDLEDVELTGGNWRKLEEKRLMTKNVYFNPSRILFGKSVVIESTPRSLKCLAVSMSLMVQQERIVH